MQHESGDSIKGGGYTGINKEAGVGYYATDTLLSPPLKLMFRTKERALLLGYQQLARHGWFAKVYAANGAAGSRDHGINTFGGAVGYRIMMGGAKWMVNGSYINNIADGGAFQAGTNKGPFIGFAHTPTTDQPQGGEVLTHLIGGYDIFSRVRFHHFSLIGEYATAISAFNQNDLTYKNGGAKPSALHAEIAYSFEMAGKPSVVSFAYDHTKQAVALGMPLSMYAVIYRIAPWRDTSLGIEYAHAINYGQSAAPAGSLLANSSQYEDLGRADNAVVGVFSLYF